MNIVPTSPHSISVIIPLYNGEAFLADAIARLLRPRWDKIGPENWHLINQIAAQPQGTL